jgi:hypothetical protein
MVKISLDVMYEIIRFVPNIMPFDKTSLEITEYLRKIAGSKINKFIKQHYFSSQNLENYVKHKFVRYRSLNSKDYNRIFNKTFTKREEWQFLPERMCANNFPNNSISWTYVERIPVGILRNKYDVYKFIQTLRQDQKDVIFRDYIHKFNVRLYE